ncbi:MAG: bifunctional shikimate kinase/3-dehydroquinate synthase [Myxococcota bacterium]|nr:bifunctional shikimate kinase/3-dehydroquinate synthase [Myxococcota bacterium]
MPPLFLIGFMAAGKTSVGRNIAATTGRWFVDLDDAVASMDPGGEPVAKLVARDLPEFRRREATALAKLCAAAEDIVIATGGGAATFGDNIDRMRASGLVVALGVEVTEAQRRAENGPPRPLLAHADRLAAERAPAYRRAHAVVDSNGKSVEDVVAQVRQVEKLWRRLPAAHRGATLVALGDRSYPITTSSAIDTALVASHLGSPSKIAVITDRNVAQHHRIALPGAVETVVIEPGEASKSFEQYQRLCTELVDRGLDRASAIVALGGGVVGDLAGFVAATLYRGIPVIQIPTTLVATTDAAIGGKTAVDLPAGKNLVGAFWQPRLVACATDTLMTLPARERRAGFGELWKYALLDGPELWRAVAACASWAAGPGDGPGDGPEGLAPPPELRFVIDRAIAYKAAIVGRDERELTGHRALLNLGHTVGHAIESASGMLHGEAVGLGLVAACQVSAAVCGTRPELATEVAGALAASGLPSDPRPWLTEEVLSRVGVDKKRIGANLKFIVVREVGSCEPVEIAVTELTRILAPVAGT